jgi:GH15 family glucan-1,4-alpha-glucosidase
MANFMALFIDEETNLPHASYDLWEEKFLTNTYTCMVVTHALKRAAAFADMFDYPDDAVNWRAAAARINDATKLLFDPDRQLYRKGLYLQPDGSLLFDNTLDISSLYGVLMFADIKLDAASLTQTAAGVEALLQNPQQASGVFRYEQDWYMRKSADSPPNPWFVCTLWLAQYYVQTKQLGKARALVDWTQHLTLPSGVLSEQINPYNGSPVGVAPLVWSHAEYINTVLDIAGQH